MNNLDIDSIYSHMVKQDNDCLLITTSVPEGCVSEGDKNVSVRLESTVPCMNNKFWTQDQCEQIASKFINLAGTVFPDISKHILFKITASPKTLYHWTNNHLGAAYGWASSPKQLGDPDFSQKTEIKNLFITGHWSNQGSGITVVANCGREAAKAIRKFIR